MLLRFEVANHRSINEPIELTMIAIDNDRPSVRRFKRIREGALTVAGIYGPNASGKSNVLNAINWLSRAVRDSLRRWNEEIPRDPFRFGDPMAASTFEISVEVGGVQYDYLLEANDSEILYEALFSYPEARQRTLFEREGQDIQSRRGLKGLGGARDLTTPTTLFLSAVSRFRENELYPVAKEIGNIRSLGLRPFLRHAGHIGLTSTARLFDNRQGTLFDDVEGLTDRDMALSLLKLADLGIDDVEIRSKEQDNMVRDSIQFVHRVDNLERRFEPIDESAGTRTWFELIGPVLLALRGGSTLLFDEIDASLHPKLSARLVGLFNDPETNPRNAQLIFTTHDTSLLNSLNRDEVWLTEKRNGATSLTALSDYGGEKVRRSLNLERAYLQGRFGAIPNLDQAAVRDLLGLPKRPADGT